MEQFVYDLLNYMKCRKVELVVDDIRLIGDDEQSFTTMIIDLLSWLKLEHKRSEWMKEKKYMKFKPLELDMRYPWCRILGNLVKNDVRFSEFYVIENNKFKFNDLISEEEKALGRYLAYKNYNPPAMH